MDFVETTGVRVPHVYQNNIIIIIRLDKHRAFKKRNVSENTFMALNSPILHCLLTT